MANYTFANGDLCGDACVDGRISRKWSRKERKVGKELFLR